MPKKGRKKKKPRYTISFDLKSTYIMRQLGYIDRNNNVKVGRNLSGFVCSLVKNWVNEQGKSMLGDVDRMALLARIRELQELEDSIAYKKKLCALELNNLPHIVDSNQVI